jgi:GMP synthase PP-ATPase subunit|tara:strand:+ start:491 stop:667 length:177 start_codon:yes stop_codon:yes gene_type:complete
MNDKVRELYNGVNPVKKRKTIGEIFYDYHERKQKQMENRKRLIRKIKRENKWKNLEEY